MARSLRHMGDCEVESSSSEGSEGQGGHQRILDIIVRVIENTPPHLPMLMFSFQLVVHVRRNDYPKSGNRQKSLLVTKTLPLTIL